jgi:FtsP/CotA-like multicopper oxidase with cupredoxin domain
MRNKTSKWVSATATVAMVLGGGVFSQVLAIPVPGGTVDPTTIPKYVTPLVIPPVMSGSTRLAPTTPGTENYNIAVRQFKQQILPGGIWNAAGGYAPGTYTMPPTTVWSYGNAADPMPDSTALGGGVGIAPAPNSTFNYPAFTVENTSGTMTKVRWINELVKDPMACFYGAVGDGTQCNYLSHLLPIDQTLHWANPPNSGCIPGMGIPGPIGTDCETLNNLPYTGPVPLVTHVHGADVNMQSDGYPNSWELPAANNIPAGYAITGNMFSQWTLDGANNVPGSAFYAYENTQPAATIWYHDHAMGMTRNNVYAGPAGFWLIRGGVNDTAAGVLPGPAPVAGDLTVPLNTVGDPKRNSIREIPIAIQDRSFDWVDALGNVLPTSVGAVGTKLWYPNSRALFDGFTGPYINPTQTPPSDISGIWNPEAFFNTMVVNGVTWPALKVAQERYRFRLLNGCNSRSLNLSLREVLPGGGLGAEYPFYQIGADQGFLPQVVMIKTGSATPLPGNGTVPGTLTPTANPMQALLLMSAERADVIVDFTGIAPGTHIRVINTADDAPLQALDPLLVADPGTTGQVMEFIVDSTINKAPPGDTSTPAANLNLSLIAEGALGAASNTRKISLNEMESTSVCIEVNAITGAFVGNLFSQPPGNPTFLTTCLNTAVAAGNMAVPVAPRQALLGDVVTDPITGGLVAVPNRFQDPISENPLVGTTEIWEIYNTTVDAHPIHLHLVRFQIQGREAMTIDPATGVMTPSGTVTPPAPNELGYKDTVEAYPSMITRVKATFTRVGLYLWHCHIVEHEDNEMMLPYRVMATAAAAPATLGAALTANGDVNLTATASVTPGVNYVFEYKKTTAPNWVAVASVGPTTTITGLSAGTYNFRVKAIEPNITPTMGTLADSTWVASTPASVAVVPHAQIAAYRVGEWYVDKNYNGAWESALDFFGWFGSTTMIPVAADWNGDGFTEIAVYDGGNWYFDMNGNGLWDGVPTDQYIGSFGDPTDIPVAGDWNGTGRAKIGIYRPSTSTWYLDFDGSNTYNPPVDVAQVFGLVGDQPVVGDWNGNGRSKIGVFRNGQWVLDTNGNFIQDVSPTDTLVPSYGVAGMIPVAGDWSGTGMARIGCYRDGDWYLDLDGDGIWNPALDRQMGPFGVTGMLPAVGKWR